MNIDAVCKFSSTVYRPPENFSDHQVLSSNIDGVTCRFIEILDMETTNIQMFEKHVKPLVKAFLAGYNACIMCYGEFKSELNCLLNGLHADKDGILNLIVIEIIRNISYGDINVDSMKDALSFNSFVLENEGFSDLLKESGLKSNIMRIAFTINDGYLLEQAANMNKKPPFRSKFTIVCWTGPSEISPAMKHEVEFGSHSSLNLLSLYNLSFHLASGKPGIRKLTNHSTSNLTKLLYDEIGGNCYTRIILCLSSNPDPEIYSFLLRLTSQLTNITNSPVMNDECALLLAARERETQYLLEEMIKEYKTGINLTNSSANLPNTESSMLKLKEHVQELSVSLGKTQEELAHATDERVKLSKAWLISEEDRIDANEKLAKTELELQEVTLKNKQLQLICEKATDAAKHAVELQKSNDMLNNYCTDLKRKLDDLHDELERMVR
ncbi:Uveal autoantigen with coiled-coil domains and ankyrin repeats protein [Schistosoma japonicum]|nr:Uveal autoantigen with coiled-coil domains and ankyrin repeats protein [Schistosoma japonicum]